MTPDAAEIVTRATAWVVVACYLARCWLDLQGSRRGNIELFADQARWLWTIGSVVFVAHVVLALVFVHGMSHSRAYEHTAERTAAVVGLQWGGGIYVNHAFLLFWIFDVIGWWRSETSWAYGSKRWYWFVQSLFAFMFLNATVIFGPSYWLWIGGTLAIALISLRVFTARAANSNSADESP